MSRLIKTGEGVWTVVLDDEPTPEEVDRLVESIIERADGAYYDNAGAWILPMNPEDEGDGA